MASCTGKANLLKHVMSDFEIHCGSDVCEVHMFVITAQSDYFNNYVRFGLEALDSSTTLMDDDPQMVKFMIEFMYSMDYDIKPLLATVNEDTDSTTATPGPNSSSRDRYHPKPRRNIIANPQLSIYHRGTNAYYSGGSPWAQPPTTCAHGFPYDIDRDCTGRLTSQRQRCSVTAAGII
ncbi:hypothetical protein K469DRAFT_689909 [Zopfia rhizophila CBS 207.26]|uniref:BTB domain-containing protein n=1 Tax=Zopfia rhizophila CBS 207.26 TaxID=1314779 RepID=A0A6A6DZR7_9PEZI|nr:hypothetical protein K469DRAFT_689909 [Zopfia rhizophila CBS 207.26]